MHTLFFRYSLAVFALTASLTFSGCKAGPDFRKPEAPVAKSYTASPLPDETVVAPGSGGGAQRFILGQDIPAQWWALFHSEALNSLISQALADNPTLAAAQATLRQALELRQAQAGALLPSLDANVSAQRKKISGASIGQPNANIGTFSLFDASVSISYTLDISGALFRQLEFLQAQIDYQRFLNEAVYLTLTSNLVTTTVRESSLRAQILATQEILVILGKQLAVVESQFQLGSVSYSDVLAEKVQIAQVRATLPPLEQALAQTRHLLAVLAGKLPHEATTLPEFAIEGFELPQELPVSLPSSLVRQRPDIRAAEELFHAASAQVGVATANLYPRITLTSGYGTQASAVDNLFGSGTSIFNLGAGLLQPLFRGGQLTAQRRAALAAYDQAAAQYRAAILQAFQNVADVLQALENDARALQAQAEADAASADAFERTRKQFELGAVSYLSLLNAERQYLQTHLNLVQARAARFADTAALFQALGGGWWNRVPQADELPGASKD